MIPAIEYTPAIVWNPHLVFQCRNRDFLPFHLMKPAARAALEALRQSGRLEYYGVEGWHKVNHASGSFCHKLTAYRITPGWNPLTQPTIAARNGNGKHK